MEPIIRCPDCDREIVLSEEFACRLWNSFRGKKQTPHAGPGRPKKKVQRKKTKRELFGVGLVCQNKRCGHVRRRPITEKNWTKGVRPRCGRCKTMYPEGLLETLFMLEE